jgi:hypothetical protein
MAPSISEFPAVSTSRVALRAEGPAVDGPAVDHSTVCGRTAGGDEAEAVRGAKKAARLDFFERFNTIEAV